MTNPNPEKGEEMPREIFMHYTQDYHTEKDFTEPPENFTRYVRADKSITIEELEAMKKTFMGLEIINSEYNAAIDAVIERLR